MRISLLVVCATALTPIAGIADPLTGRVEVRARARGTAAQVIVYAEPLDRPAPTQAASFEVTQKNKTFTPRVLGVPVGSTVTFPNDDAIFHNVFSLSSVQPFDLGLYRAGASKSRTFTRPTVYHVFCNIHPQMAAFVVVAPTPWVTVAGADGAFRLDVPPGRYRVTALSERESGVRGGSRRRWRAADHARAGRIDVRACAAPQQVRQAVSERGVQARWTMKKFTLHSI